MGRKRVGHLARNERGFVLIFVALAIPIMLIFAVGLIDLGLLHLARSNLQAAIDATALSAAREGSVATVYTHNEDVTERNQIISVSEYEDYQANPDKKLDLVQMSGKVHIVPTIPFPKTPSQYVRNSTWASRVTPDNYFTEYYQKWEEWDYFPDWREVCDERDENNICIRWVTRDYGSWKKVADRETPAQYVAHKIVRNKQVRSVIPGIDLDKATAEAEKVLQMNFETWVESRNNVFRNIRVEQAMLTCTDPNTGKMVSGFAQCPSNHSGNLEVKYEVLRASIEVKTNLLGNLFSGSPWVKVTIENQEATTSFTKG